MIEKQGTQRMIEADLIFSLWILYIVFTRPAKELNLELDKKAILNRGDNQTSQNKVFASGDAVSGASLVVRAIAAGRKTAQNVHEFLSK